MGGGGGEKIINDGRIMMNCNGIPKNLDEYVENPSRILVNME